MIKYWYHAESESYFLTNMTEEEEEEFCNSANGGLCNEISFEEYIKNAPIDEIIRDIL